MKYAIPNDQIKHEITENMALKRPPYTEPYHHIRSSYEPTAMLKYPPAPGAPLMPPALPQDMKYTQPVDMKYKPPENLSKTQFSADNLVKGYDSITTSKYKFRRFGIFGRIKLIFSFDCCVFV